VLDEVGIALVEEAGGQAPGQRQRRPHQAEQQPAGIGGHHPAIEGGVDPAATNGFKSKAIRVTVCAHRELLRPSVKSLTHKHFH
jgi:hypothetical protein